MAKERSSGLNVWFKEEVGNIIRSIDSSNRSIARHVRTSEMAMYRMGFKDALDALSEAFGLSYDRETREIAPRRRSG